MAAATKAIDVPLTVSGAWPTDANGNEKVLVKARVKELIPTVKYANVELEFEASLFVDEDKLESSLSEAYDRVDGVLNEKRDPILASLEAGNN